MKPEKVVVPKLLGDAGRVRWSKRQGDAVTADETILEVDLGYGTAPVLAPFAGRLQQVLVPDGAEVAEGTAVGIVEPDAGGGGAPPGVCSSCGVVWIDRAARCEHCHARHAGEALPAPGDGPAAWACVECTFRCRACGFVVPLDHLAMGGAVECGRCGLEQAFETRSWHDAFDHAHAVADGMIAGIGRQHTSSRQIIRASNAFEMTASPGHPVCRSCHALLGVSFADGHRATATCANCKTSDAYATPAAAVQMMNGALTAVLATEHRADGLAAKVEKTAEAIAVHCPSCSAPLDASDGTRFVHCKYCNTTCRIPASAWLRLGGKAAKPESMWLAFEGPSRARRDADKGKAHHAREKLVGRLREAKSEAASRRSAQGARDELAERLRVAKRDGTAAQESIAKEAEPRVYGAAWQEPAAKVPSPPAAPPPPPLPLPLPPVVAPTPPVPVAPIETAGPPARRRQPRVALAAVVLLLLLLGAAVVTVVLAASR
jgi:pyruvate/2-oxoglutarate dehydrogenase complex dihydrolipoamide acyltransferase (E2) component